MNINQRVKYAIVTYSKSQAILASEISASPSAMSKYVNGLMKPSDKVLEKLAAVTGINYDWLKTGSGKDPAGFKDFITSTGLSREELLEKVENLESKVDRLKKENQALRREND